MNRKVDHDALFEKYLKRIGAIKPAPGPTLPEVIHIGASPRIHWVEMAVCALVAFAIGFGLAVMS